MDKSRLDQVAAGVAAVLVRAYQLLTMGWPHHCRFAPSCSEYALEALRLEGFARGSARAIKRIVKCHPWHPGGYDPVHDGEWF